MNVLLQSPGSQAKLLRHACQPGVRGSYPHVGFDEDLLLSVQQAGVVGTLLSTGVSLSRHHVPHFTHMFMHIKYLVYTLAEYTFAHM